MTQEQQRMLWIALVLLALAALVAVSAFATDPTCEDWGFDYGCKQDPPVTDPSFECDANELDLEYGDCEGDDCASLNWMAQDFPLGLVAIKGGPTHAEYFYDPPAWSDSNLTAPDERDISHVHFCWNDPPLELGSCCFECDEPGTSDECEDEATEAYCDIEGGIWAFNVPCSQREDCNDDCPFDDPTVGGGCLVGGDCIDGVEEGEYYSTDGAIEDGWIEGATCDELVCTQVPAMSAVNLIVLTVLLVLTSVYIVRSVRWQKRK